MGSSDITNVYAALDRTHTVVALERSRRGDEGFRTFFDEFADYAANKGYIPYLLLLNFHVDDGSRLPPIEAKERGYRLAHLAPLEVKDIRQALMLYDLLYCRKHGLDPLAAQNTARNLCYKDAYAGFRNESIPALSQPGAPYGAATARELRGCGNGGRRSSFPPRRTTCRFCSKRVRRYNTSCACTMLLFVGK